MGEHLHIITRPSMRYYAKACEMRKGGFAGWRDNLLQMICAEMDARVLETVARLMADRGLTSFQREQKFKAATGMLRDSFYRYESMLREARGEA